MSERDLNQLTIWSLTVRLTHWLVALAVTINFVNDTGYWHRMIGYVCLLFIFIRIVHGLTAKQISSHFSWPYLTEIVEHVKEIRHKNIKDYIGHNPIGQMAVYLMWTLIILLGFTGWLSRTDVFWGEDGPVVAHSFLAELLMICVLLHIAAVFVMSVLQKKNLIKPMIVSMNKQRDKAAKD